MAAPTQLGQEWKLGFGGAEYTGYMPTDASVKPTGEEEIIKDENNASVSVLTYDKGKAVDFTFLIKSTGSIDAPEKNSLVSLKAPGDAAATKYRAVEAEAKFSRGVTEMSMSLIREVSMAAAYDA